MIVKGLDGTTSGLTAVPDPSYAYWAGYLAEHLRIVLTQANPNHAGATALAIRALADFDAWCEQRDPRSPQWEAECEEFGCHAGQESGES